jgi:hypothetical protein
MNTLHEISAKKSPNTYAKINIYSEFAFLNLPKNK